MKVLTVAVPTPRECPKFWCRREPVEVVEEWNGEELRRYATCKKGHSWPVSDIKLGAKVIRHHTWRSRAYNATPLWIRRLFWA